MIYIYKAVHSWNIHHRMILEWEMLWYDPVIMNLSLVWSFYGSYFPGGHLWWNCHHQMYWGLTWLAHLVMDTWNSSRSLLTKMVVITHTVKINIKDDKLNGSLTNENTGMFREYVRKIMTLGFIGDNGVILWMLLLEYCWQTSSIPWLLMLWLLAWQDINSCPPVVWIV